MKRLFAVALVAAGTIAGAASAQERTSSTTVLRSGEVTAPVVQRRCAGVGCLRYIPSLGVAF